MFLDEIPKGTRLADAKELDLSGCQRVASVTMKTVGRLETLEKLSLDGTSITDDSLTHVLKLESLNELSISHCKNLTRQAVDNLEKHPSLETINAVGLSWTDADAQRLEDAGEYRIVITKPVKGPFDFD